MSWKQSQRESAFMAQWATKAIPRWRVQTTFSGTRKSEGALCVVGASLPLHVERCIFGSPGMPTYFVLVLAIYVIFSMMLNHVVVETAISIAIDRSESQLHSPSTVNAQCLGSEDLAKPLLVKRHHPLRQKWWLVPPDLRRPMSLR